MSQQRKEKSILSKMMNLKIPIVVFPSKKKKELSKKKVKPQKLCTSLNCECDCAKKPESGIFKAVHPKQHQEKDKLGYPYPYPYPYDYYPYDSDLSDYDSSYYDSDSDHSHYHRRYLYGIKSNMTTGNYIITFNNSVHLDNKIANLNAMNGFKHKHKLTLALYGCTASVNSNLLASLMNDPDIQTIERDSPVSDALHEKKEVTQMISPLWNQTITNTVPTATDNFSTVHCYILDTGIMANHTEFATGQVSIDFNAIAQNNLASDDNGHGTAVASVLGGKTVGAAVHATLHAIKVLDSTGSGYTSDVIAGLDWVLTNKKSTGKVVINLSLGGSSNSNSLDSAIKNSILNNCVVVCAAGNGGVDASSLSPANAAGAFTISAYDSTKTKPTWSNFGPVVASFAPGVSVKSAWNSATNAYSLVSGTSFSSPITAGIIARYLKVIPRASQMQIATFLHKSSVVNEIINPGANTINARIVWNAANAV